MGTLYGFLCTDHFSFTDRSGYAQQKLQSDTLPAATAEITERSSEAGS